MLVAVVCVGVRVWVGVRVRVCVLMCSSRSNSNIAILPPPPILFLLASDCILQVVRSRGIGEVYKIQVGYMLSMAHPKVPPAFPMKPFSYTQLPLTTL